MTETYKSRKQGSYGLTVRMIAFATAFFFSVTNLGIAGLNTPRELDAHLLTERTLSGLVDIPGALGEVRVQALDPKAEQTVLYIEDAHAIRDAQTNIEKLIGYLHETYGVRLVALEGGEGKLDPTLFRAFPDETAKKQVFNDYLGRAELTGTEMAAIFGGDQVRYFGVEDWDLYEQNYLAYLRTYENRENLVGVLNRLRTALDGKRKLIYSPELNEFYEKANLRSEERRV